MNKNFRIKMQSSFDFRILMNYYNIILYLLELGVRHPNAWKFVSNELLDFRLLGILKIQQMKLIIVVLGLS